MPNRAQRLASLGRGPHLEEQLHQMGDVARAFAALALKRSVTGRQAWEFLS